MRKFELVVAGAFFVSACNGVKDISSGQCADGGSATSCAGGRSKLGAPDAPSVSGVTPTNDTTPTWIWTAGYGGNGTFRHKLDSNDFTSGATETTSTSFTPGSALSAGDHTLYVQERDAAGNWSASGSKLIEVDTTGPTPPTVTGVTPTNDTTPSWIWTSGTGGSGTFRYKLDSNDFTSGATETTSTSFTPASALSAGDHTFYVQERDDAGNWSTSGSRLIAVDTTAPTPPTVTGSTVTNDTTPTWNWTASSGGDGTFRYKLDSSDFTSDATETTSTSFTPGGDLSAGDHTLYVQARDDAGNWSASDGKLTTIETTPPTIVITSDRDPGPNSNPAIALTFTFSEPVIGFDANDVSVMNAVKGEFTAMSETVYTLVISATGSTVSADVAGAVATDAAGNGNTAAMRWSITYAPIKGVTSELTASSPQRKTFFDGTRHWAFWYSGSGVNYGHGTSGTSYAQSATTLAINSPRFTVSYKSPFVIIGYESGFDINVLRGTISGTMITWETAVTALDGSGAADAFSKPALTVGTDDRLYVAAFHWTKSSGVFTPKAARSNGSYSASLDWPSPSLAGTGTANPAGIALVPQGSHAMAITNAGGPVQSFAFNGSSWTRKTGSVGDWWSFFAGLSGVNGDVTAIAILGTNVYVAGDFSAAGSIKASHIVKWDTSASTWSSLGSGVNGVVGALAVSGTDLYVVGDFDSAGGVAADRIAKWDTSTSTWSALGSGVNGWVRSLAVSGTELYVAGYFTSAGGVAADRIAKWDTSTSTWSALGSGVNGYVSALAVSGTNLYVGGDFDSAGGVAVDGIAKWNTSTSTWSALGELPGGVQALAVIGTELYVAEGFVVYGRLATRIAKWNTSTSTWSAFEGQVDGWVNALAVSGTDLYVGGIFSASFGAGGVPADRIAKFDTSTSNWSTLASEGNESVTGGNVNALAVSGTDLYVGGTFTYSGGVAASKIAMWDTSTSRWSNPWSGVRGTVNALAVIGTDLYLGGEFTLEGGSAESKIAKWDGSTWSAFAGVSGNVTALAVIGTDLYVGGGFDYAGYDWWAPAGWVSASSIAKWDASTSTWSALGSGVNGNVTALAVGGTDLYVGGDFTAAGGGAASKVAKWDTSTSTWSALGSGVTGYVKALAVSGTDLYVGGDFQISTDNGYVFDIAKWNGYFWRKPGSGVNGNVTALAVSGTDLYVGGEFDSAGGVAASKVAKWDTSTSTWSALGNGVTGDVKALAVNGTDLYLGGNFTAAGGVAASNIAKWDGASWSALGSGQGMNVKGLGIYNGNVYAVGDGGVSAYFSDFVASATSISATSDSAGVQLAYVRRSDSLPYYMTFNDTSWNTPAALGASAVNGQISLATSADSSQWLVAWGRGGQVECRKYSSSTWGALTTVSSGKHNFLPTLPEVIGGSVVPVLWTNWVGPPYEAGNVAVTFP